MSWSIGRLYEPGTLTSHELWPCNGAPRTVDVSLGTPTMPLHLFVMVRETGEVGQTSQATRWHIQVSSDDRKPAFVAPALSAGAPAADAAHAALSYLQCLELDGVGAPCPETYETQYGAVFAEIPAGDDLHLALPAGWTIERIAVDAVPSSLIYYDPSPAGVRRDIWSRHATRLRRACRARRRPGPGRMDATRAGHRDRRGSYDQRLVRRPDCDRRLTGPGRLLPVRHSKAWNDLNTGCLETGSPFLYPAGS